MSNGYTTSDLMPTELADEVLVNRAGSTGRQQISALATQLAGSGPIAEQIAAKAAMADLQSLAAQITTNRIEQATWAALSAITPTLIGQGAEVPDSDTGTHTDPVVGGTVPNAGRYTALALTMGAWKRIGDTGLSDKIGLKEGVATNVLWDAWNEHTSRDANVGGWSWQTGGWTYTASAAPPNYTTSDANIATGGSSKIVGSSGVPTDKYYPFKELGLAAGQTVTIAVLIYAAAAGMRVSAYFRDASNTILGSALGVNSAVSGVQVLTVALAVPAGAVDRLMIRVESVTAAYEIAAYSLAKGAARGAFRSAALPRSFAGAGERASNRFADPFGDMVDAIGNDPFAPTRPAEFDVRNAVSGNSPWGKPSLARTGAGSLRRYLDLAQLGIRPGTDRVKVRVAIYADAGASVGVYTRTSAGASVRQHISTAITGVGYFEFESALLDTTGCDHILIVVGGDVSREILAVGISTSPATPDFPVAVEPKFLHYNHTAANLHPDPFWRRYAAGETTQGGVPVFYAGLTAGAAVTTHASVPFYGQRGLVVPSSVTASQNHYISVAGLGLRLGDVVTILTGIYVPGGTGSMQMGYYWRESATGATIVNNTARTTPVAGTYSVLSYSVTVTQAMLDSVTVLHMRYNVSSSAAFTGGYVICANGVYVNNETPALVDQQGPRDDLFVRLHEVEADVIAHETRITAIELGGSGATPEFADRTYLLRETRQRLRSLKLGDSKRFTVACIGDSYTHNAARYTRPVAETLQTDYGDAGPGWVGFGFASDALLNGSVSADVGYAKSGTWTSNYGTSVSPDVCDAVSSQAGAKLTITYAGSPALSGVDLYHIGTADGVIRYRWSGGAWTTLNVQGTVAALHITALAGVPASDSWTLDIEVVSGTVKLAGANLKTTLSGVVVHKLGATGSRATQWSAVDATQWQAGLASLDPDLAIVMLAGNDYRANATPAIVAAAISTIIDRIRAAQPRCDVLVMMQPDLGETHTYTMFDYADAEYPVTVAKRAAWLNLQGVFGDEFADYAAGGVHDWFNADLVHPDPSTGGRVIVDAVLRTLTA